VGAARYSAGLRSFRAPLRAPASRPDRPLVSTWCFADHDLSHCWR